MTEYKFRAWDIEQECYFYWEHFNKPDLPISILFNNRGLIVEQWIGKKDAFGTDIYEGDILNRKPTFGMKSKNYIVGYDSHSAGCNTGYCYGWFIPWGDEPLKVVGNIYENPDLLEEE